MKTAHMLIGAAAAIGAFFYFKSRKAAEVAAPPAADSPGNARPPAMGATGFLRIALGESRGVVANMGATAATKASTPTLNPAAATTTAAGALTSATRLVGGILGGAAGALVDVGKTIVGSAPGSKAAPTTNIRDTFTSPAPRSREANIINPDRVPRF